MSEQKFQTNYKLAYAQFEKKEIQLVQLAAMLLGALRMVHYRTPAVAALCDVHMTPNCNGFSLMKHCYDFIIQNDRKRLEKTVKPFQFYISL